ncbi:MAG TPA: aldehyde ferredoxin oxidoreductase N-terminal domain-containing protein [Anaerolineae bacterium]|nr:aldehyde ferredoxin oxidoreductase N-terminal domain-containing protein [Anaerolineae bacterium]
MLNTGYVRVLLVDLATGDFRTEDREDLWRECLGGTGVASCLLGESVHDDRDPLDPAQPVAFANGPLTTIFPVVTKTVAAFRSPLTGEYGESHAGGRFASALRYAGYDALLLTGAAKQLSYLVIHDDRVELRTAAALRGMDTIETGRVIRDLVEGAGHRSILRIGPAGESRIRFANANVDTFRHFGRLGLGAVLGSKNLKAIAVTGQKPFTMPAGSRAYKALYAEVYDRVLHTDVMKKYHELGTPVNILPLNEMGALPTYNVRQGYFGEAGEISGEAFAEGELITKRACTGCQIGCIHVALYRRPFAPGWEYESTMVAYDHELVYAAGSLLGIGNRPGVLRLIEEIDRAGMDVISCGTALAWATEAMERGTVGPDQFAGLDLRWGDVERYSRAVALIAAGRSELGQWLSQGEVAAARHYGGDGYVAAAGGQGIAGYWTGYAHVLGHLLGARHSHLDNGGYAIDQKLEPYTDEAIVDRLIEDEAERIVQTSMSICLFARGVYDLGTISQALASIGMEHSVDDLRAIGQRIYWERIRLRERLGFKARLEDLPHRFFETPTPRGQLQPERMARLLQIYQARRAAVLG